jgi:diguanylate cyclase (GGDEF)-like protein
MNMPVPEQPCFEQFKATGKLPSPTGIALTIMSMTQSEDVTLAEVAKVIQADPALLGRVLKLANSPGIGARRPITTAFDGLSLLGLAVVRQLAHGMSIVSNFSEGSCSGFDYRRFWSQSLAAGSATQMLCRHSKVLTPEDGFSCGLLSRVGRLALATLFPREYGRVLSIADSTREDFYKSERRHFGTDHNELTAALLQDWKLPKVMVDAVYYQEDPENAPFEAGSRTSAIVHHLHFANVWALMCVSEESVRQGMLPRFFELGQRLGLDRDCLMGMDAEVTHEWIEWGQILNIPVSRLVPIAELEEHALRASRMAATGVTAAAHAMTDASTVLVAEGDAALRELALEALREQQTALAASDGAEALRLVSDADTAIIVTAFALPDMPGGDFIRALRALDGGRDKYVIALVTADDDATIAAAVDAGADDFLLKPFIPRALEARVHAAQRIVTLKQEVKREMREVHRYVKELANANQRWEQAAFTDALTGLPNRRYAMERLKQEWASSVRNNRPLSCLLIDIDYFKHVNDSYGHDGGDLVLHSIANVLKTSLRTEDVICRTGGEEFLVICSDTSALAAANGAATRLNKAVANHVITTEGGFRARVTISIGVAGRSAANATIDALLKAADIAVYEAKKSGRNRVCLAK